MAQKNLHVMMTADAKGVEASLSRVEAGFKKLQTQTAGLRNASAAIVGGASPAEILKGQVENLIGSIPLIGPAFQSAFPLVESFYDKLRQTQKDVVAQGKEALAVGGTIEGYSALRFAVSDVEALDKALHKLNIATVEAAMGNEEARTSFERLGLDWQQLMGMPAEKKFHAMADAIKKVENGSLRAHEAQKILGKGSLAIMSDLLKGSAGLEKLENVARKHGKVITSDDVASAQLVNAQMKQINMEADALWRKMAIAFAPAMRSVADDLSKMFEGPKGDGLENSQKEILAIKNEFVDLGKAVADAGSGWYHFMTFQYSKAAKDMDRIMEGGPSAENRAAAEMAKWQEEVKKKKEEIARLEKQAVTAVEDRIKKEKEELELKKQQAELEKRVQAVVESSMTPYEKFSQKIANINELAGLGKLSWEQYAGGLAAVVSEFDKLNQKANEYRATESLELGTAGEAGARYRSRFEGDQATAANANGRIAELVDVLRQQSADKKKTDEEILKELRRINQAKF